MLVDSIEAASRTIDPPNREQFEAMIQRVVFTKLRAGQLDEAGLDIDDLRIIITRMADTLVNMHHHRIKYPWQSKRAEEFGVPREAVVHPQIELHGHSTVTMPPSSADDLPQVASHLSSRGIDSGALPQLHSGGVGNESNAPDGPTHNAGDQTGVVTVPTSGMPALRARPVPPRAGERISTRPHEPSVPPNDSSQRPASTEHPGRRGQNR